MNDDIAKLSESLKDAVIFLAYEAGLAPTPRAIEEAEVAREAGISLRHYVGKFSSLFVNKRGETCLCLFVYDRGKPGDEGRYRTFNPKVGRLRLLEILTMRAGTGG